MTWIVVIALAVAAFVLAVFVLKAPRRAREAVAAALVLGMAGYVTQGSPRMPSAPKDGEESAADGAGRALVEARLKVTDRGIPPNSKWVVFADGLTRNGQYAEAAEVLRLSVAKDAKDSDAWLAMANALLAHSDGVLTPAALFAYRRAALVDPGNPGPPFFLGLALLQGGRIAEGRTLWAELLARAPADAQWREPLAQQLAGLDAAIARSAQAQSRP